MPLEYFPVIFLSAVLQGFMFNRKKSNSFRSSFSLLFFPPLFVDFLLPFYQGIIPDDQELPGICKTK